MSFAVFTPSICSSSLVSQPQLHNLHHQRTSPSNPSFLIVDHKCLCLGSNMVSLCKTSRINSLRNLKFTARNSMDSTGQKLSDVSLKWDDQDQEQEDPEDLESPWEGAIIYKRNPSISHLEYCTTLERLGLQTLSTEVSKSRASIMGLRVTKAVKDYPLGTPVQISIDVTRKKKKLRLDGMIKTVITLACNRCGEATAESIYSNLGILLSEEAISEPDIINMGVMFGEDKYRSGAGFGEEEEDEDDSSVDWDDRLYFPPEEKEIDISKNIRDLIHIEITLNAICGPSCKGLCLKCGTNLNTSTCRCNEEKVEEKGYGPLKDLKAQMQPKG
ncbi:large ribosomal RNA subunit accumulation protein YCED homolog 1, chloroplastic [Euphorbia lathyris]|uniref:large ribosomal RNA subunit accumulation protein YCED homolog 1, chloroplastic n=1 Tax=Euphorbia lathyris TaxID=212925 RepID=UPI003313EFD9